MNTPEDFGVLINLPVGVCAVDTSLNIRFWNRRMELWTGLTMDDVSGRLITELFPHLEADLFLDRLNDSIYRHIPQYFSSSLGLSIIPEDKTSGRPMEQRTSIVPYRRNDGSDEYALLIIEDISDLKKRGGSLS
ncbi:PAS domain-containing protein [Methanolacinia petrolearia]|uniref:PAS domain-containing protein n=1 Tax=Methanolacinia petrolearia TaxID=54120 RepID=UPI003BAAAC6D